MKSCLLNIIMAVGFFAFVSVMHYASPVVGLLFIQFLMLF